ncbi:class I glutamine amidotransferase-like protein [Cryomyces antarcticus]
MASYSSTTPSALILVADGTEEIEFVTPYDVLTRAGFNVHSVGINTAVSVYARCSRNVRIVLDSPSLAATPSSLIDAATMVILPGGAAGSAAFCASDAALRLVREFRDEGKWVASICAGTTALVASRERESARRVRVTSHPSVKAEIVAAGWEYADEAERVVVCGKVITSRGPGTALAFSLALVEALAGREKREEVMGPMVCAETL